MSAIERVRHHWLATVNLAVAVFVGLPFLAPILLATGFDGAANAIYAAYQLVCHQWAFRSFFVFGPELTYTPETLGSLVGQHEMYGFIGSPELGYKVAFCERDVAIYLSVLAAGLLYARYHAQVPNLGVTGYAFLIVPMAVDGFTQLLGWRESSVLLRTVTGALFGLASVWLVYPRVDALFERDLGPATTGSAGPTAAASTASAHPA